MERLSAVTVLAVEASAGLPVTPYWGIVIGALVVAVGMILFNYLTRSGTIARATIKESLRQPVFALLTLVAIFVITANYWIPFFTLGSDTLVFKDCGLQTILISALLLGVWTASMSVAEEIEGKTAMTLLSKPINRRQFILGKYMGILQTALILVAITGTFLIVTTYFKVGYDQRESGKEVSEYIQWDESRPVLAQERLSSAADNLPALALISFEVAIMTAISVAISTRAPMMVNMVTCFAIFVIGHLTPVLVQSTFQDDSLVFVRFFAQLLATILPTLDNFNMSTAVSTGAAIPGDYLVYAALYCVIYVTAAVLLAFLLFEDRDLA